MLEVWIVHGYTPAHRTAVIGPYLVDVAMNATVSVSVLHDCVDECAGTLIEIPSLDNQLWETGFMVLEEELSEARCALFGAWIIDADLVESLGETLSRPDFYLHPRDALDVFQHLHFPLEKIIPRSLNPLLIDPDAPRRHLNEAWEQFQFQIRDCPQVFFGKLNTEAVPEFQREFGIDFSIGSNEASGHLPHLGLRIDTKFSRRLH